MARLGPQLGPEERLLAWQAWQAHVGRLGHPDYDADSVAGRTAWDLYSHGARSVAGGRPGMAAGGDTQPGALPPRSPGLEAAGTFRWNSMSRA